MPVTLGPHHVDGIAAVNDAINLLDTDGSGNTISGGKYVEAIIVSATAAGAVTFTDNNGNTVADVNVQANVVVTIPIGKVLPGLKLTAAPAGIKVSPVGVR